MRFLSSIRLSFRVTITTLLLTLLTTTVLALGIFTYINAKAITLERQAWSFRIGFQLINERINRFLEPAYTTSRVTQRLLETGFLNLEDFGSLSSYWLETLRSHLNLDYLIAGMESSGEYLDVSRYSPGKFTIREIRRDPDRGELVIREYWPEDYPRTPFQVTPDAANSDPRTRPWYQAARKKGEPVWTDVYVFLGQAGQLDKPGFTYATPVFNPDKTLKGVIGADFILDTLCTFLASLRGAREATFFIVEVRDGDTDRVIAHPEPDKIMRKEGTHSPHSELIPEGAIRDPILSAFLEALPNEISEVSSRLDAPIRFFAEGEAYLGGYCRLADPSGPHWVICGAVNEAEAMAEVRRNNRIYGACAALVFFLAVLTGLWLSARLSRPLQALAADAGQVGQGLLDPHPGGSSFIKEIDCLLKATEEMKAGLRSFQKYVPQQLVRDLLATGEEASLGGERRNLTVFFSDLVGFTRLAEGMPAERVVEILTDIHELFCSQIMREGGTIDKFIGDALMALWGAPLPIQDHALPACRAALGCTRSLAVFSAGLVDQGHPPIHCRIGINTGEAVVGNLGAQTRLDYTAIGDEVNLGSRLEGLGKYYGISILISESTFRQVSGSIIARPIDRVSVAGRERPTLVYELHGLRGEQDPLFEALADAYTRGLESYFRGEWTHAAECFRQALSVSPNDKPSHVLLDRCTGYRSLPPPSDWDGIHRMKAK